MIGVSQHKKHLKEMLRNGVFDGDLVFFSKAELKNARWEHDKEFYRGDEKYDIVKTTTEGNVEGYLCINDKKEESLIKGFQGTQKKSKLLDELIKKITIQEFPVLSYNFLQIVAENDKRNSFEKGMYSCQWIDCIIKPPISQA